MSRSSARTPSATGSPALRQNGTARHGNPRNGITRGGIRSRAGMAGAGTAATLALLLSGCVSGEGSSEGDGDLDTLNIDFATYNPLSLIIRDQGWLEDELEEFDTDVNWIQSAGSNKANENLRSEAIDVGSTAGSAALLARANGAPIETILVADQPEWTALVTNEGSDIDTVEQLEGASVAATRGTDPYFFLIQALDAAGIETSDVEVQNLQHADGWRALENGDVDAWSGLDPIMAGAENDGAELFFRDLDLITYSFVNATEDFTDNHPEVAQKVVDVYEQARQWAEDNPEETAEILAEEAGLELDVAERVIQERSNFDVDPVPGEDQRAVLENVGPLLVDTGDVADQDDVDTALDELFNPEFAEDAEATSAEEDQ